MNEYLITLSNGISLSVYADVDINEENRTVEEVFIESVHELNDINLDALPYELRGNDMEEVIVEISEQALENYYNE